MIDHDRSLFTPAFQQNPHTTYEAIRQRGPLSLLQPGVWAAVSYDAVQRLLKERRLGRGVQAPIWCEELQARHGLTEAPQPSMLFQDPPTHTRLRALVNQAFTPRAVNALEPWVRALSARLLAPLTPTGRMQLLRDYARPLPALVIAQMLGVPEADQGVFEGWADALVKGLDPVDLGEQELHSVRDAAAAFHRYFAGLIEARRRAPGEDLLSGMLAAEAQGDRLSSQELLTMCVLLFVAGHETTMNLIGNGLLALLQHPTELARLQREPALIPNAVEELLRFCGPVQLTRRVVMEDLEVDGQHLRAGDRVLLFLAAANRDPVRYAAPDQLDVTRPDVRPLAFGSGIHYCLGAPLARLEATIAFEHLLGQLQDLGLDGEARWSDHITLRGLQELPLAFSPRMDHV